MPVNGREREPMAVREFRLRRKHSKKVSFSGVGRMKISNLVTITNEVEEVYQYCHSCYSNSCSYRGEVNHLPWSTLQGPVTEIRPSQDSFHNGSPTWKLHDNGCFTFQRKSIHLDISLVPSHISGQIKLILGLNSCPQGASVQFDEIKKVFVTLHLLDNLKSVIYTKYLRMSVQQVKGWKDLITIDDNFYSIKEFGNRKVCRVKGIKGGKGTDEPSAEAAEDELFFKEEGGYEFVKLRVELQIVLQPREGSLKCLTVTTCNGVLQEEVNIRVHPPPNKSSPPVKNCYNNNNISGEMSSTENVLRYNFDEGPAPNSVKKSVTEFSSKFSDIVTIKVGPELQHSFPIHKHVICDRSPVFKLMFESDMLESKTSELKLADVTPEIMEAFLSVVYGTTDTKRIEKDVELMVGILMLGHQYQMDDLVKRFIQILITFSDDTMTERDALHIYTCGFNLHISELQSRALQWFTENKEANKHSLERVAAVAEFIENEKSAAVSLFIHLQAGFCPENN